MTRALPTSTLSHRARGSGLEQWVERHLRILMLAPAMLVLLALTIFPSAYMFVAAVTRISPNPDLPWEFAGLQNFTRLLTDQQFHIGLRNTLVFTVSSVTIEFLLGLGLALLLDRYVRKLNVLKTLLMLPMMLPPVAVAITWKLIYEPQFGILNELMFNLGRRAGLGRRCAARHAVADHRRCLAVDAVHVPPHAGRTRQPADRAL